MRHLACGRVSQVAQLVDGNSICRHCYQAPRKPCGGCGELREVAARAQDGVTDLCHRCYRTPDRRCGVCQFVRPVHATWPLGPICVTCYRSVLRDPQPCSRCRQTRALIGRSIEDGLICGTCAGSPRDYLCVKCGAAGEQHFKNLCKRCSVGVAAEQILASVTGRAPLALAGLPAALANHGRPDSTMRWIDRPIPKALLKSLGAGETVTHSSLDRCPPGQAREHLRSLLVAARVLPSRDEHADHLATWIDEYIAALPRHHPTLITPYAHWMVLRLVRRRARKRRTSVGVAYTARERVRAAARLLRHLDHREETIADLSQATLDEWIAGNRSRATTTSPFIRWLNDRGITNQLLVVTPKGSKPTLVNPEDVQHAQIHDLLAAHSPETELPERVVGLLVLLFGARLERIHRLTTTNITPNGRPPPPRAIRPSNRAPRRTRRARRTTCGGCSDGATGAHTCRRCALPLPFDASTARSVAPEHTRKKARSHGVRPQITRNTAMVALAADLPAAVIAVQFGLTPQAATTWAQHSRRDSIEYLVARDADAGAGR